jgi:hypothetical protein
MVQQLQRYFDVLAGYDDADFRRLLEMLEWISGNPNSGLYPRQIPVAGVDSKWLESCKGLISDLVFDDSGSTGDVNSSLILGGISPGPSLLPARRAYSAARRAPRSG